MMLPSEELARIDVHIRECERRISEQERRIDLIRHSSRNCQDSEQLLGNLIAGLNALYDLRELVKQEVQDARSDASGSLAGEKFAATSGRGGKVRGNP
ncbi:hypothetical protein OKW49_008365 [Paraburkholderia youngii]|uniref:hypothetical protein n=1 Tax=Paraburkholderia youngii TaxID=2782701 RepID=UPI003D1C8E16